VSFVRFALITMGRVSAVLYPGESGAVRDSGFDPRMEMPAHVMNLEPRLERRPAASTTTSSRR
jgi:hypothetical protein